VGNFPYNISSQIFFTVLQLGSDKVPMVVAMLQREVARRLASEPGNKEYGILSVLLQARYKIEYCFTVSEQVFNPPPKVKSGVIRLTSLPQPRYNGDWKKFTATVKAGFNQRRKTLRNALRGLPWYKELEGNALLDKRAEQLSVEEFGSLVG
jgi:16S rRNA (adenine1518-N6/adenine1519-N6)-dimethyltransferase